MRIGISVDVFTSTATTVPAWKSWSRPSGPAQLRTTAGPYRPMSVDRKTSSPKSPDRCDAPHPHSCGAFLAPYVFRDSTGLSGDTHGRKVPHGTLFPPA